MIEELQKYLQCTQVPISQNIMIIQSETEQIDEFIKDIDAKLLNLQFQIENSSIQSRQKKIKKYLMMSNEDLLGQCQLLQKQSEEVDSLINFMEKYLNIDTNNISESKELVEELHLLIKQSIISQRQKQFVLKNYQKILQKIRVNSERLVRIQNKESQNIIIIESKMIRENIQILDQQIIRCYINILFNDLLSYRISDKNYYLQYPHTQKQIQINQDQILMRRCTIIFAKEDSENFIQQIIRSLEQIQILYEHLSKILSKRLDFCEIIKQIKYQILDKLRSELLYIIPYLTLSNRKIILNKLENHNDETSIGDLLVKLKLKGQDGQMLISTIHQLSQKIKINQKAIEIVLVYLEIIGNSKDFLNIGFFLANELLQRLQGFIPYNYIKMILISRENLRDKIHNIN